MRKNLSAAQRLGWIPREVALQNDARIMPIIREIQAAGITSLNGIARALDERGIPTPLNVKGWSGEQVRRMLARSADAAVVEAAPGVQRPPFTDTAVPTTRTITPRSSKPLLIGSRIYPC